jgi:hypothetical protein
MKFRAESAEILAGVVAEGPMDQASALQEFTGKTLLLPRSCRSLGQQSGKIGIIRPEFAQIRSLPVQQAAFRKLASLFFRSKVRLSHLAV